MSAQPRSAPIRGDGVGIEITTTVLRGVGLRHDEPGRVVAVGEVAVGRPAGDRGLADALVRLHAQLDPGAASTRIGWLPPSSTMQRVDVTGRTGPELNALRRSLADDLGIVSSMLIDTASHRYLFALHWDHTAVRRLERLAEAAGFADVSVEPAPLALLRVISTDPDDLLVSTDRSVTAGNTGDRGDAADPNTLGIVVRRRASDDESWTVVAARGVAVAATCAATPTRIAPGVEIAAGIGGLHRFERLLAPDEVGGLIDEAAAAASGPVEFRPVELRLVGQRYPPFPAHEARAPERVAVALGAAVGAAGLAGRLRPVDLVGPSAADDEVRRPWAIERISAADPSTPAGPTRPSRPTRLPSRQSPRRPRRR